MARVTVYDVAEKAGVSTATVSFAFRHPDKVKDDTKAKVLRVAEELGYVPSGNARSLAKGRTGTLACTRSICCWKDLREATLRMIGLMFPPDPSTSLWTVTNPTFLYIRYTLMRCFVVSNSNAGRVAREYLWEPPRKGMITDL